MKPLLAAFDFGTSTTQVATLDAAGEPHVVARLPSLVSVWRSQAGTSAIVGNDAAHQAVANPRGVLAASRRLLGRALDDPETRRAAMARPLTLSVAPNGDAWYAVADDVMAPQEVAGRILAAARTLAEQRVGRRIDEAVITVPSTADPAVRRAVYDAAQIAGLPCRRLVSECTAAALGARAHRLPQARVVVCHLGAGRFEVALFEVEQGVACAVVVESDPELAGDDFDRAIFEPLSVEIAEHHGVRVADDPAMAIRLAEEVVKAKDALSAAAKVTVQIPTLPTRGSETQGWLRVVGRMEVESWTAEPTSRFESLLKRAIARVPGWRTDRLVLAGGLGQMPALRRRAAQRLGCEPMAIDPDAVAAEGAAIHGAILSGRLEGVVALDAAPSAIGLHAGAGRLAPVIHRGATLPARETRMIPTVRDGQRELKLEVYSGAARDVQEGRHLATFEVLGLPDAPAGEVLVLVDFTLDVDGVLGVSAREVTSGQQAQLRLAYGPGLTRAQLARLRDRAAIRAM